MTERITIIQGHPDNGSHHLCHALAETYRDAALVANHTVRMLNIGEIDFPLLTSKSDWERTDVPPQLKAAQEDLLWAEHWVIFYPVWLGTMPAKLKGFFEQVLRPGSVYVAPGLGQTWHNILVGRSARLIVTMATPLIRYKYTHGLNAARNMEHNILNYCGVHPVHTTLIGNVYGKKKTELERNIETIRRLGAQGD